MFYLGCFISSSKGFTAMGNDALRAGANTFQFFSRNPRGSQARTIDPQDVAGLLQIMQENNFAKLLAHAPYTINPSSATPATREFAVITLADDMRRLEAIPGNLYVFHPGSHTGQGVETGLDQIVEALDKVLFAEQTTTVLLETMSGKGSEIGKTFEELQYIIQNVQLSEKLGVCFDTCHTYSAGYDIVNNLDGVLDEFDSIIGLEKLYAIHLNDSKYPMSVFKDRHEKIGEGSIGLEATARLINHPKLKHLPFYLETPNELEGYAQEIALLKQLYKED